MIRKELGIENSDLAVAGEMHRQVSREIPMETMDVFVACTNEAGDAQDDEQKVRISFDPPGQMILEAVKKEAFVKLNIYTGQDTHEEEVNLLVNESENYHDTVENLQTAVDFRISINKESEGRSDRPPYTPSAHHCLSLIVAMSATVE